MKKKTRKRRLLTGITSLLLTAAMIVLPVSKAFAEGEWDPKWSTTQVGTNLIAGTEGTSTNKWIKFKLANQANTGQTKDWSSTNHPQNISGMWGTETYKSYDHVLFSNGITYIGEYTEGSTNTYWRYIYLPKTLKKVRAYSFNLAQWGNPNDYTSYDIYFGGTASEWLHIENISACYRLVEGGTGTLSNPTITLHILDKGEKELDLQIPGDKLIKVGTPTETKKVFASLLAAADAGIITASRNTIQEGRTTFDLNKDGKDDFYISYYYSSDGWITKLKTCSIEGDYTLDLSQNNKALDWPLPKAQEYYSKLKIHFGYDLSNASLSIPTMTYSGSEIDGVTSVKVKGGSISLSEGFDYQAEYKDNVNAGTATVTITGKDNKEYYGTQTKTFTIKPASMASSDVKITVPDVIWPETNSKPVATFNEKMLVEGTDYDLTYYGNTAPGNVSVKLTGKGNFSGDKNAYYSINPGSISGADVTVEDQTWTGSPLKPAPVVKIGDVTLVQNTDYTVAYTNNTDEGTATATITGMGYYSGTAIGTFKITKPKDTTPGGSTTPGSTSPGGSTTPGSTTPGGSTTPQNNDGEVKTGDTVADAGGVTGQEVKVDTPAADSGNGKVIYTKAPDKKSVTVPETITIGGKTYDVETVEAKAFSGKKIRTITIGKKVKKIKKYAFKGSKATKLIVKTKKLTKKSVKGCLKGSKIKTVQVKVGSKKTNKKYVKKYKKIFTKKNAGRKVKVK